MIEAIAAITGQPSGVVPVPGKPGHRLSFLDMIASGVGQVEDKLQAADAMVQAFVLDDSVPVHQVTIALEEARLSLELMLQVRNRMVEGYQQLMNMQL